MSDEEETMQGEENGLPSNGESAAGGLVGEQRLAAVEAERDEMKDRMLRIAAEFENWKKRARKESDDAEAKARESVLRDVLDVIDNLERALGASKTDKSGKATVGGASGEILKGVELVLRLFQTKLERYGVKPIVAVGQAFDPRLHEAISRVETAETPAGSVATELQRGYMIGERLLRPSLVAVATPPPSQAAEQRGDGGESSGAEGKRA